MNVDLIFRIAAIGSLVAVLNQLLIRSGREEQAMMTTLAGRPTILSYSYSNAEALATVGQYGFWYIAECSTVPSSEVIVRSRTPSGAK